MKTLEEVRAHLLAGEFDYTAHAHRRAVERNISDSEIGEAGTGAIVIEDYPDDKYGPSCLMLGFTIVGRPLHIQVSLADTPAIRIITLYEPDPDQWEDYVRRR